MIGRTHRSFKRATSGSVIGAGACVFAGSLAMWAGLAHGASEDMVRAERGKEHGKVASAFISGLGGGGVETDPVLASHFYRMSVLDLGLREVPSPTDYQLTTTLLSFASDLDPTNASIARSVVEAAWSAGDLDTMMLATRRVITSDPHDTVAQLRLISSVINKQQTIDDRLRYYDRYLGQTGRAIDASVRSRLALDAALLERERGNMQGFIERLHLATKLDITNKSAASLTAQFHSQLTDDQLLQLEYQFRLLFADPLDPNVHLMIARILASEGGFDPAHRFLENSIMLFRLESGRVPSMIEEIRLALDWQTDGPQAVLDDLNPMLRDQRAQAKQQIENYIEAQLPTDGLIKPEEILYELGVDKIRLLATYNQGDQEQTQDVLNDIERTVNNEIGAIGSVLANEGVDQRAMMLRIVSLFSDYQVMRAIVGLGSDKIRPDIADLTKTIPAFEPYLALIEPMALYAEGSYELAIEQANKQGSSPALDLIRGLASEKLGRREESIELFFKLSQENALDSYGAFARSQLFSYGVGDMTLTAVGKEMVEATKTIPDWVDQMNSRPSIYMYLDLEVPKKRFGILEQSMIKIRLKNVSPIPLSLGPSQPIDSRFLILPSIDQDSAGFQGEAVSKVLGLNHRLRLRPLEEMEVTLPADSVQTQWLLQMQPNVSIRQRYRLLQGFRPRVSDDILDRLDPEADAAIYGIVNSPLGLTSESDILQRLMLEESTFDVDELAQVLDGPDETARRRAVIASAGRLLLPATGEELPAIKQSQLVGALMELYTRADSNERARMILVLPHRHQVPKMMSFDDHVVSLIVSDALIDSRVDSLVLAAALLTRTDAVDSPIFEVLDQTNDPRLVIIAEIIRNRLGLFSPTLGTIGPGVESMMPTKERFGQ